MIFAINHREHESVLVRFVVKLSPCVILCHRNRTRKVETCVYPVESIEIIPQSQSIIHRLSQTNPTNPTPILIFQSHVQTILFLFIFK